jgi:NMD protein affecting ribosome stability and mRNA decay
MPYFIFCARCGLRKPRDGKRQKVCDDCIRIAKRFGGLKQRETRRRLRMLMFDNNVRRS